VRPLRTWIGNFFKGVNSWVMLPLIVQQCCWYVVLFGFGWFTCRAIQALAKR